jgi:predicted phosphate transport protein (TIGR00153 family)
MRSVRLALVPRPSEFFDLFARAGQNVLEAARKAEQRFQEYPSSSVSQSDIKAIESEGDAITRDLITLLNTQYVTPFDREDIYQLATTLDDVIDNIEEATDLLELYAIEQPTRHSLEQCRILVGAAGHLCSALSHLKGFKDVQSSLVHLRELEDEGDRVVREAIATLFHQPKIDPLIVIRWKDIYEALEAALDACDTSANVLGNIVVKNA